MSQFILCEGSKRFLKLPERLQMVSIEDNDFLKRASRSLFSRTKDKEVWSIIEKKSKTIDSLFTEAQRRIGSGENFVDTDLVILIKALIGARISFCLWYGEDWLNLPMISEDKILECIKKQLMEMPGEIYLKYIPERR